MVSRTNLDMDVLRTFVTGFELGSFARAADRLGRSQSAVSTQLRKLEEQVGQPLVRKSGRGLVLTLAGESLLGYAKRILELNDDAIEVIRGSEMQGWVRLGLSQDLAESWLPAVLKRFIQAHPKVRTEVQVDRSAEMIEKVVQGELDLALVWDAGIDSPHTKHVAKIPIAWVAQPDWPGVSALGSEPLPLVVFAPPCSFRTAGIAALDAAGIRWRLTLTTPSLSGLWAAAEAGLGVTARTPVGMPKTLALLDPAKTGLPPLPEVSLILHQAEMQPGAAVARLTEILVETIQLNLAAH